MGGMVDKVSRTIKCDSCENSVTFDPQSEEDIKNLPLWIRTTRTISLGNRTQFMYCSDVCEVKGVTTGNHNIPEPKSVTEATPAQAAQVAAQAKATEQLRQRPGNEKVSLT